MWIKEAQTHRETMLLTMASAPGREKNVLARLLYLFLLLRLPEDLAPGSCKTFKPFFVEASNSHSTILSHSAKKNDFHLLGAESDLEREPFRRLRLRTPLFRLSPCGVHVEWRRLDETKETHLRHLYFLALQYFLETIETLNKTRIILYLQAAGANFTCTTCPSPRPEFPTTVSGSSCCQQGI